MNQRTKRGFVKVEPALDSLRVGRDGAVQVCRDAKISSKEYLASQKLIEAIDELAGVLTGDKGYFHLKMATADQQPRCR